MDYYRIEYSTVEREVGSTFPQSHTAKHPIQVEDPRHLWKQDIGKFPENVCIPEPVLHPDAVLTDLVSSVVTGTRLIISDKLKSLLESHIVAGECEFLHVPVTYIDKDYSYWMLNPIVFRMELINYSASEIWLTEFGFSKLNRINIKDYSAFAEWISILESPRGISITKLGFLADTKQDFIQLRYVTGGIGYYVSEKLKMEIEKAKCTGLRFVTTN